MILVSTELQTQLGKRDRILRSKIDLYNTAMAVDTDGIQFKMFTWDGDGEPTWTAGFQSLPADSSESCALANLSLHWGYGAPFYMNQEYWGVQFSGEFYAEETGNVYFYFFGHDIYVKMLWVADAQILASTLLTHNGGTVSPTAQAVTSGNWYAFKIRIWGGVGNRLGGFSGNYTYDSTTPTGSNWRDIGMKPVNAGVVSSAGSFLSATSIERYFALRGTKRQNEPSAYQFSVPYGDETGGYKKDANGTYTNGTVNLKEGKLVKIYAGYDCSPSTPTAAETVGSITGNVEYIPRFVGYIEGFDADRKNNQLTVHCRDFMVRAEGALCVNYPDSASYWSAGYTLENHTAQPDGLNQPIAYDKWGVVDAIKDLLMKSGIPYSLFTGSTKRRQSDDTLTDSTDAVIDNGYRLDFAKYYNTDQVEEYVHKYDIGTTVYEAVIKIVDSYGYRIGFRYDSYLAFHPTNNATSRQDHDQGSGDGVLTTDANALGGAYRRLGTLNDTRTYTFTGTGVSVVVVRHTTGGLNDNSNNYWDGTASVQLVIKEGATPIHTYNYNFYFLEEWFYTDGIHQLVGTNPCLIHLEHGLDYGTYTLEVINQNSSYDIDIDEVWVYNFNMIDTVKSLQTYLYSGVPGTITNLSFSRGIQNQRNDILVVGQRKGQWVPSGDKEVGIGDSEYGGIANKQYTNYHARSLDVESIYNPNAANYIGRHQMTYIQEPNINSYDRARWLSFYILDSYREIENDVDVSVVGDCEIDLEDPITIVDKVEETAGDGTWWVKNIEESIESTNWNIRVDVSGHEPYPSYEKNTDYDTALFNDNYLTGLTITDIYGYERDGDLASTLNGMHTPSSTTLTLNDAVTAWPSSGTVVVYHPDYPHYGVFEYTSKGSNSVTGTFKFTTSGGARSNVFYSSGWRVRNEYNPYEQADSNSFIKVSFTCLVAGEIQVGVRSMQDVPGFISGLSGGGGLDRDAMPVAQEVNPGDEIELIWGGVDQPGLSHKSGEEAYTGDLEIGKNFFARDGYYYIAIYYRSSENGDMAQIMSSEYVDENSTTQKKKIKIGKSGVDSHMVTWSVENTARNFNFEYHPTHAPQGGYQHSQLQTSSDRINKNAVWMQRDGNINVTLKSYYVDSYRTYSIKYDTIGYRNRGIVRFPSQGGSTGNTLYNTLSEIKGVTDKEIGENGGIASFSYTDGYTFAYNPTIPTWGGFDFDNDANATWDFFDGDDLGWTLIYKYIGVCYFVRLLLDIRDMSGRRVKYINSSGGAPILPQPEDLISWVQYVYREYGERTVLEHFWVPAKAEAASAVGHYKQPTPFLPMGSKPAFEATAPWDYTWLVNTPEW